MSHSDPSDGDGPRLEELFGITEQETVHRSRSERYYTVLDGFVFAPARIAWSDWRARLGIMILAMYAFMAIVLTRVVGQPYDNKAQDLGAPYDAGFNGAIPHFSNEFTQDLVIFGYNTGLDIWQFPLGTNPDGKPIFESIVHATPAMFELIIAGGVVSIGIAVLVGTAAGYKGGFVDSVLMSLTDVVLTTPGLPLILLLTAIYQPRDPFILGMLLAIDNWPGLARLLRSQVLTIRQESYVEASRAMGVSTGGILQKDIVPQLMPYIMINAAGAGKKVIVEAVGLYFLNILQYNQENWGLMMDNAYQGGAVSDPNLFYWIFWPMFALSLLAFSLVMLAQGLDKVFNPRLRARHAKTAGGDESIEDLQS